MSKTPMSVKACDESEVEADQTLVPAGHRWICFVPVGRSAPAVARDLPQQRVGVAEPAQPAGELHPVQRRPRRRSSLRHHRVQD